MTLPSHEDLLAINEKLCALNRIAACSAPLQLYPVLVRVLDEALAGAELEPIEKALLLKGAAHA